MDIKSGASDIESGSEDFEDVNGDSVVSWQIQRSYSRHMCKSLEIFPFILYKYNLC